MSGHLSDFESKILPISLVRERFVETGVYLGETMAAAARYGFRRLDGIEINADAAMACCTRFAPDARIAIHHGSSPVILPAILLDVPTTFWLDAHFPGKPNERTMMDREYGECPLLAELRAVTIFPWTVGPAIAIDDVHMFEDAFWSGAEAWRFERAEWPTLDQIKAALHGYAMHVYDDILYAIGP